jgi:hypothetical protein
MWIRHDNAMRSWEQFVAEAPVVGYLLKVSHEFIKLANVEHSRSLTLFG